MRTTDDGLHTATRAPGVRVTAPFEESPLVARVLAELTQRSERGGASSIRFLPSRATTYDAFAFAYGTKLAKQMNVVHQRGPLRGTLIVNASGHVAGALVDRVVGFALHMFDVGHDALRFEQLRASCARAVDALTRGAPSGMPGATIALEAEHVALPAELFARLRDASPTSDEAIEGDDALRMHFGATNTYVVHIALPNGDAVSFEAPRNDPARIELATRIPLEIPALDGAVLLEASPKGARVDSYVEARRYLIHLADHPADRFDVERAVAVAKKFEAAHAEVRWGTAHEESDRVRHRVAPSPMPYQDS